MFRSHPQSAIMGFMRFVPIVSIILSCLALNAQMIQGKVVRVVDGDTITILDEGKVRLNRIYAPENGQPFGDLEMMLLHHSYSANSVGKFFNRGF